LKVPEFIGGLLVGFSIFSIVIGIVFLPKLDTELPEGNVYYEIIFPYIASIIAGIALGFGLRDEEGGYGGWSGGGMDEQWPTLIGAIFLAISVGLSVILFLSNTPLFGITLALSGVTLVVFGFAITIFNWETTGF
jgi:hypothetical protein